MDKYALIKEDDKIIVADYNDVSECPYIRICTTKDSEGDDYYTGIGIYSNKDNRLSICLDYKHNNRSIECYICNLMTQNEELSSLVNELLDINKNEIDQESAIRIFDELMKYSEEFNRIYDEAMDSYMMNTEMFRLHPNRKSAKTSND